MTSCYAVRIVCWCTLRATVSLLVFHSLLVLESEVGDQLAHKGITGESAWCRGGWSEKPQQRALQERFAGDQWGPFNYRASKGPLRAWLHLSVNTNSQPTGLYIPGSCSTAKEVERWHAGSDLHESLACTALCNSLRLIQWLQLITDNMLSND